MTYQEKMTRHLAKAEQLNDEVDVMERVALDELGGPGAVVDTVMKAYQIKKHFEHDELYRQKGNARNVHMSLATMYGIAALVEAQQPQGEHHLWPLNPSQGS